MIKATLYPKTDRISDNRKITISEKLDGSNLVIFKYDNEIHIAMRNKILPMSEVIYKLEYRHLNEWLSEHAEYLYQHINEKSCICCEWMGMGKIGYGGSDINKKLYMFAKANVVSNYSVEDPFKLENIKYDHDLFIYPFDDEVIPDFIGTVPIVTTLDHQPRISELDELYKTYCSERDRKVEGFVIAISDDKILKYVRYKNKKMTKHLTPEDMVEIMNARLERKQKHIKEC